MFKKTKIAAVTAAVLGVSAVASAAVPGFVSLGENGSSGQVLIFPYYNVNNGFSTSFNITNTTNKFKAIKVRFRESNTSNDVLDFNVYMSPKDVFTMGLTKTATGGVLMQTTDTTCTHPMIPVVSDVDGVVTRSKEFIGANVYDSVSQADVREGYLEVIEMGEISPTVTAFSDEAKKSVLIASEKGVEHVEGVPGDCSVIANAWDNGDFNQGGAAANADWVDIDVTESSDAGYYGAAAVTGIMAPTGGLTGSSVLIDTVNIAGFVAEPITINGYSATAQHYLPSDKQYYLLPSLASGSVPSVVSLSDDNAGIVVNSWTPVARDFGLDDPNLAPNSSVPSGINPMPMANAMLVTRLANQYFVAGETSTDWVIAAPMRKHGIFNDYQYMTDGNISDNDDTLDIDINTAKGGDNYWKYLPKDNDISAVFKYYDREESVARVEPGDFSPPIQGETVAVPFEREVNILALTAGGENPSVLGSDNAQTVTMDTGFVTGWGEFDFSSLNIANQRFTDDWVTVSGDMSTSGAPLTGFASARGTVNGQNLGETFPMSVTRTRGNSGN